MPNGETGAFDAPAAAAPARVPVKKTAGDLVSLFDGAEATPAKPARGGDLI